MKSPRSKLGESGGIPEIVRVENIMFKIRRYKIITMNRNTRYFRDCYIHSGRVIKIDLIKCLSNILYSGAHWVVISAQERLELLVFVSSASEANKLRNYLPKALGVTEYNKK